MRSSDRMPTPSYTFVPPSRHIWEVDAGPDVTNEAGAFPYPIPSNWVLLDQVEANKTRQDAGAEIAGVNPDEQTQPRHALSERVKRPMTSAALAMTDDDVILRRREAAALARVSVWKLDEWMRDYPDFPVRKLGPRTFLIPKRDFMEWLRNHGEWGMAWRPTPAPSKKPKRK